MTRTCMYVALCVALASTGSVCCQQEYVPYVPIDLHWNGEIEFVEAPSMLTDRHASAIQVVLERYGKPFVVRDKVVYIPRWLQEDQERIFNYSQKAEAVTDEALAEFAARCKQGQ